MRGASANVGGAGEGMPGTEERSGALKRETRSFDCTDGGQDEHAESRT